MEEGRAGTLTSHTSMLLVPSGLTGDPYEVFTSTRWFTGRQPGGTRFSDAPLFLISFQTNAPGRRVGYGFERDLLSSPVSSLSPTLPTHDSTMRASYGARGRGTGADMADIHEAPTPRAAVA